LPPAEHVIQPDVNDVAREDILVFQRWRPTRQTWLLDNAQTKATVVTSMDDVLSMDIVSLATSQLMWACLQQQCEPRNEAMFLAILKEIQSLQQMNATMGDFFRSISTA
jgi:hypothetical protein